MTCDFEYLVLFYTVHSKDSFVGCLHFAFCNYNSFNSASKLTQPGEWMEIKAPMCIT